MRIRIVQEPSIGDVDGVDLTQFHVGREYDLGVTLASVLLAEGWAEPIPLDAPPPPVPFGPQDPFTMRIIGRHEPPALVRDEFQPSAKRARAADTHRPRQRPRK
jgi:hypothetical protein